jgi:hypothetical protein
MNKKAVLKLETTVDAWNVVSKLWFILKHDLRVRNESAFW